MYKIMMIALLYLLMPLSLSAKNDNQSDELAQHIFNNFGFIRSEVTDYSITKLEANEESDAYLLLIKGVPYHMENSLLCKRVDYHFKIEALRNVSDNPFPIINQFYYSDEQIKQKGILSYSVLSNASEQCDEKRHWIYYNSLSNTQDSFLTLYNWSKAYVDHNTDLLLETIQEIETKDTERQFNIIYTRKDDLEKKISVQVEMDEKGKVYINKG